MLKIITKNKEKIFNVLTKPYVVILVLFFAPLLSYFDRNFSFFFGLAIVLLILKTSNYNWSLFGFKKITKQTILKSFLFSFVLLIVDICISLIVQNYFGEPNLSSLEDIKHNTVGFIVILIVVWTLVAFGEEFLFRGYYIKWLARTFGNTKFAWILSILIISTYFSLSHYYQGISGVISIFFISLIISFLYLKNKDNLGLFVLIHGISDTYGLSLIYLDIEEPISGWILQMF